MTSLETLPVLYAQSLSLSINGCESQWCNEDKLCFILSLFLIPPPLPPTSAHPLQCRCVCYYFVDILVQAECAGAWLVMAGYVCNVWADAARGGTEQKRRRGEGGADSWILICQPQAAVRQTVDGGQSTHDDDSPDKSESGPQLAART